MEELVELAKNCVQFVLADGEVLFVDAFDVRGGFDVGDVPFLFEEGAIQLHQFLTDSFLG